MKTINIIFTRHNLTDQQHEEIGYGVNVFSMAEDAKKTLVTRANAHDVLFDILGCGATENAVEIRLFGVIPPILRSVMAEYSVGANVGYVGTDHYPLDLVVYEAHNINRAEEGEKPVFEFDSWVKTGKYRYYVPVV